MDKRTKILGNILSIAMLMIMLPVLLKLLHFNWQGLNYVFAIGAVTALVVRILDKYHGDNLRIKRLYRISTVSALCYCLSAYFKFSSEMHFFPYASGYDWLGFLTAGAALQIYAAFTIGYEEKKSLKKKIEDAKKDLK